MKRKKHARVVRCVGWLVPILTLPFALGAFLFPRDTPTTPTRYGITWSTVYAQELGVDPIEGLRVVIEELGVRLVRVPVYWNRVESTQGDADWRELDALMRLAEQTETQVILVVGARVPRWPECFYPTWALDAPVAERVAAQEAFVSHVVMRYKDSSALVRWQVENEPFLKSFGVCPAGDAETVLRAERALVGRLDAAHPVQITASGELAFWGREARIADIVGVSVYRRVYTRGIGYLTYPIPPWVYRAKAWLIRPTPVVISELQAEPWFVRPRAQYTIQEQLALFGPEDLTRHVRYAQRIGADEVLLWGAEWWLLLKKQGSPGVWEAAQQLDW